MSNASVKRLITIAATATLIPCAQVPDVKNSLPNAAADNVDSKTLREQDKAFSPQFGPVEFADAFGSRETDPPQLKRTPN